MPEEELKGFVNPFGVVKALTLRWHLHRGPADVAFTEPVQEFEDSADQNPTTSATFSAPGEYWLRAEALDGDRRGRQRVPVLLDIGEIVQVTASR